MRLLLDTHVVLWAIAGDVRLNRDAERLIADHGNDVFVSVASVWEITIKRALNRGRDGDMPISGADAVAYFNAAGYQLLSITCEHVLAAADLPPLHRDPFDRLIVAQALHEPLRLITHDADVRAYSDTILLV